MLLLSYIPESLRSVAVDVLVGFGIVVISAIGIGVKRALKHLRSLIADNKPNGGSSMRDAIDKITRSLERLEAEFRGTLELETGGYFLTDSEGRCLWVSSVWVRITGVMSNDALGDGWIAGISSEDQTMVWDKWRMSAKTKIPFDCIYKTSTGLKVHGKSVELRDQLGQRVGFLGVISLIPED